MKQMMYLMYLITSMVCFTLFKAVSMIKDRGITNTLIAGIYMLIGIWAFVKLTDDLDFKAYGRYNIGSYILPLIIMVIPISVFFIDKFPNLTSILIIELIFFMSLDFGLQLSKKRKKKKNVNKN